MLDNWTLLNSWTQENVPRNNDSSLECVHLAENSSFRASRSHGLFDIANGAEFGQFFCRLFVAMSQPLWTLNGTLTPPIDGHLRGFFSSRIPSAINWQS